MQAFSEIAGSIFKNRMQARYTGIDTCSECGAERQICEQKIGDTWQRIDTCLKCEDRKLGEEARKNHENMKRRKAAEQLKLFSTMNDDLQSASFETYTAETDSQKKALQAAQSLTDSIIAEEEKPKGILLSGSFGIGKSHLAAACCHTLAKHAKSSAFISITQLKRKITSTFQNGSKLTPEEILDFLRTVDLLVIDDLGTHQQTEFIDEIIQDLIESRQGKANFYTTNLSGKDLIESLNPRVFDRIKKDTLPIKVEGRSRRDFSKESEWNF